VLTHWHFGMVDITRRRQAEDALRKARDALEERVAERTAALARRTAELNQRNKQLARLSSELTLAEQRERRRLADLLHDHLQQMLAGARLNLDIVSQQNLSAEDPAFKAVELASRIDPDVILMDISMPVMDGIEATRIIHARKPHIKIIGLSMHDADVQAAPMQEAGAVDFLSKSGSPHAIVATIRRHWEHR